MGFLGAWALVAIGSGQAHSHKCKSEWKSAFIANEKIPVAEETKSIHPGADETFNAELHYPGSMNLILQ